MATVRASLSHEERTAQEPREQRIEPVILSRIDPVNDTIRLLRLSSVDRNHTLKVLTCNTGPRIERSADDRAK